MVSAFSHEERTAAVLGLTGDLRKTLLEGGVQGAVKNAEKIRGGLIEWQRYDEELLNRIQLSCLYQNIIFIITVFGLLVFLTVMQWAARRSDIRMRQNAAYTRSMELCNNNLFNQCQQVKASRLTI
jgi:hypothetical protein